MTQARRLGRFGVWRSASLVTPELAVGIERLGFGALWLGSSPAGDLVRAEELLGADHVCLQLITAEGADPLPGYRALAPALGLS